MSSSKIDAEHACCTICGVYVSIAHEGKSDIVKLVSTAKHKAFDLASHIVQLLKTYFGVISKVDEMTKVKFCARFALLNKFSDCVR